MIHVAGVVSVDAVLRGGHRPVSRVIVGPKRPRRVEQVLDLATGAGVPVEERSESELVDMDPRHGGILAEVGERVFTPSSDLWSGSGLFLAHLDGIEDPFNFGQAVRTLYAAGCSGVLLAERNWMSASATVTRASAGATELMPMAIQPVTEAVKVARGAGVTVVATSDSADRNVNDIDLTGPVLVLFGGERRGVTRSVLREVEAVRIPYGRQFPRSLGTVAATSVVAFEVLRQRRGERKDG